MVTAAWPKRNFASATEGVRHRVQGAGIAWGAANLTRGAAPVMPATSPVPAPTVGPIVVREAAVEERAVYEAFVSGHPAGSVLQSWVWGEMRARQHWRPTRLLARDRSGRVCGAASILCRDLPVGGTILYLPRGPVLDFHDHRVLDAMVGALRRCGDRRHAVLCKIDPYVSPPDPRVARALALRGFVVGHRRGRFEGMQPRFNVIVPLEGGEEAVLARLHSKTRYNVRLAAKRGVEVRRGGRADLAAFWRLLLITCARNGFSERQLPYFEQVWDALAPEGHIELYFAALGGRDLAAAILFLYGDKAVYAYGASSDEHRDLMAPYALQWAMIRRAIAGGCRSYDMTGVPAHRVEGEPGYGLYRFKRGFWPEVSEFLGERDLPLQPTLYRVWNVVEPAYWGGHVWVKRAMRTLRPSGVRAATEVWGGAE